MGGYVYMRECTCVWVLLFVCDVRAGVRACVRVCVRACVNVCVRVYMSLRK